MIRKTFDGKIERFVLMVVIDDEERGMGLSNTNEFRLYDNQ
jgi:hypothetical protein